MDAGAFLMTFPRIDQQRSIPPIVRRAGMIDGPFGVASRFYLLQLLRINILLAGTSSASRLRVSKDCLEKRCATDKSTQGTAGAALMLEKLASKHTLIYQNPAVAVLSERIDVPHAGINLGNVHGSSVREAGLVLQGYRIASGSGFSVRSMSNA